ncbi:MAG: signal peptidase I [Pirellulaceae bacterium]
MAEKKNKRRKMFGETDAAVATKPTPVSARPVGHIGSIFDFFNRHSTRETVESIVLAVALAMLFRTFGAENYIIPTGSMAPTLQGQHMDVVCDHCDYRYRTGSSEDNSTVPENMRLKVLTTYCPFCRSPLEMNPHREADHSSYAGDRIAVNKFIYDFKNPERFDVIVFKNPNDGKQNFIKRCVGLENENILIENGDIFLMKENQSGTWTREIVRKPPKKLMAMKQVVDDTNHIARKLTLAGWPSRWQEWTKGEKSAWTLSDDPKSPPVFSTTEDNDGQFLRYRHLTPDPAIWNEIENGKTFTVDAGKAPGRLITDFYCYNFRIVEAHLPNPSGRLSIVPRPNFNQGNHWVGDIGVEANVDIKSTAGELILDIVEGGVHFSLTIDLASGVGTLTNSQGMPFLDDNNQIVDSATVQTPCVGTGTHDILMFNADDQIFLWVDGRSLPFTGSRYEPLRKVNPKYSPTDPGDAEPIGIATNKAAIDITRLQVWRDIYYTSVFGGGAGDVRNETDLDETLIQQTFKSPEVWEDEQGLKVFDARFREDKPMFVLGENQFFPMGDNSPESSDARIWNGPHFLDGKFLIGRAMFIYWPHAKRKPVPFTPNFERMGPIR